MTKRFSRKFSGYIRSVWNLRSTRLELTELYHQFSQQKITIDSYRKRIRNLESSLAFSRKKPFKIKLLICDDFHINEKNFKPVIEFSRSKDVESRIGIVQKTKIAPLMHAHGDYKSLRPLIEVQRKLIKRLPAEELKNLTFRGVNIFESAQDEIFSFLLAKPEMQEKILDKRLICTFNTAWEVDKNVVIDCCAAAMFWVDFWTNKNLAQYHACVMFSGSLIYSKVLMKLLTFTKVKNFVCESFFTGDDFFIEERYQPIANASKVRCANYTNSIKKLALNHPSKNWHQNYIHAMNKVRKPQNKNVTQPQKSSLPKLLEGKEIFLILGQVVNDFSIISGCSVYLNTIPIYKEIIQSILSKPNTAVIFKAHPWEMKKKHINSNFTMDHLKNWSSEQSDDLNHRLFICSDFNLQQLFKVSSHVVTLCSQGAIEAAMQGFKPIVIGGSFYDQSGFTENFTSTDEFQTALKADTLSANLSLDEFKNYCIFINLILQYHLLNVSNIDNDAFEKLFMPKISEKHHPMLQSETSVQQTWFNELTDQQLPDERAQ